MADDEPGRTSRFDLLSNRASVIVAIVVGLTAVASWLGFGGGLGHAAACGDKKVDLRARDLGVMTNGEPRRTENLDPGVNPNRLVRGVVVTVSADGYRNTAVTWGWTLLTRAGRPVPGQEFRIAGSYVPSRCSAKYTPTLALDEPKRRGAYQLVLRAQDAQHLPVANGVLVFKAP